MNILQSYHNSVYNSNNRLANGTGHSLNPHQNLDPQELIRQNEKKELQEINNRLGVYVRAVRELSENRNYLSDTNVNLLNSMKYLENDLDNLKQLYENEFKNLRQQVDTLIKDKNKLLVENQTYEKDNRELTQKLIEEKLANKTMTQELNECKSRTNELEYIVERMRVEIDKPTRDLCQLQIDYGELTSTYQDTTQKLEVEIGTRQSLEAKLNDLNEKFAFSKKIYEQEIESLRSQMNIAKNTIADLDMKLKDTQNSDVSLSNLFEKLRDKAERELETFKHESHEIYNKNLNNLNDQVKDVKQANDNLKLELTKYEQRYGSLKALCHNLEATIHSLENNRNILENDLYEQKTKAIKNLNDMDLKLKELQDVLACTYGATNQPVVSLNVEIEVLKELTSEVEKILQQLTFSNGGSNSYMENRLHNLERMHLQTNDSSVENLYQLNYSTSNENTEPQDESHEQTRNQSNFMYAKYQNTSPTQLQPQQQQQQTMNIIGPIARKVQTEIVKSVQDSTPLQELSTNEPSLFGQSVNNEKYKSSSSFCDRTARSPPHVSTSKTPTKDYTSELFTKYQKSKFEDKQVQLYNSVELPATDSSYIGNVKIHEVNKNGYFIRLLNVSNNCDEDLSSYTIQQIVSSMPVAVYQFPENLTLPSGHTVTVWARTDEVEQQSPHTFVWQDQGRWGTGVECTTILAKPNGQAVSWTTGSHKYGAIDDDEITSVFTKPQKRTRSAVHLIREKMNPHLIIKPNLSKNPQKSASRASPHRNNVNGYSCLYNETNESNKQSLKNSRLAKSAVTRSSNTQQQHLPHTLPLAVSYFRSASRKGSAQDN